MICNQNMDFKQLNKEREMKGIPPVNRRQFCKCLAASSVALTVPSFIGCDKLESCGDDLDIIKRALGEDTRAEIKLIPGVELDDYSGPFRPHLRYTDFSKIGLSRFHQMASEYHNAINNAYRGFFLESHGIEGLIKAEKLIWGTNMILGVNSMIKKTMNIKRLNLESFMKQWQIELNTLPNVYSDVVFEMPTKRRGLATFNRCAIALQFEAAGRTGELRDVCMNRCPKAIQNAANLYSPYIKVKNLTMPPRLSEDHVCCKWELYYKADGSQCDEEPDLLIDPDKMDKRGELTVDSDVELDDYSGPFRPNLKITDFSREQLARMFLMYHQYDLNMILNYQIQEMVQSGGGYEAGTKMQVVVWSVDLAEAARSIMMKYLNTSGAGIDCFLKAVQVDITAQPPNFENSFEMPDENTGIYTFHKCFGITMMELTGGTEEQIIQTCELDPPAIGNSCGMYSRGLSGKEIHLDIITMPPRRCEDEICCQWKFTYVDKG
ncbi:MAG: hypothetical protein KJ737_05080 [Proteobacteria bacterium]|nr:hypothetical protein [Pseudomonadota bacterium]